MLKCPLNVTLQPKRGEYMDEDKESTKVLAIQSIPFAIILASVIAGMVVAALQFNLEWYNRGIVIGVFTGVSELLLGGGLIITISKKVTLKKTTASAITTIFMIIIAYPLMLLWEFLLFQFLHLT
jgi:hypothetical protein